MQISLLTLFLILILKVDLVEWKYSKLRFTEFSKTYNHTPYDFSILLVLNTFRCFNCKEILFHQLRKLKYDDIVKNNNIGLGFALATSKDEEYCKIRGDLVIDDKKVYLYLATPLIIEFKGFNDYLYSDNLYEKTIKFVRSYLKITNEIESLEEFNNLYNTKKLIFVYLGRDNLNYEKYMGFIRKDIILMDASNFNTHSFYFSFNKNLRKKILKQFKYKDNGKDIVGVFRHDSLFNKYDNENLIVLNNFRSKYVLWRYLRNLQYNKVRTYEKDIRLFIDGKPSLSRSFSDLVQKLMRHKMTAVVYFSPNDSITKLRSEFEKALHLIPKIIPMAICNTSDQIRIHIVFKLKNLVEENIFIFLVEVS